MAGKWIKIPSTAAAFCVIVWLWKLDGRYSSTPCCLHGYRHVWGAAVRTWCWDRRVFPVGEADVHVTAQRERTWHMTGLGECFSTTHRICLLLPCDDLERGEHIPARVLRLRTLRFNLTKEAEDASAHPDLSVLLFTSSPLRRGLPSTSLAPWSCTERSPTLQPPSRVGHPADGHARARGRQPEGAAAGQGWRGRSRERLGCDSDSPVPSEHGGSRQRWVVTYWLVFLWEQRISMERCWPFSLWLTKSTKNKFKKVHQRNRNGRYISSSVY